MGDSATGFITRTRRDFDVQRQIVTADVMWLEVRAGPRASSNQLAAGPLRVIH